MKMHVSAHSRHPTSYTHNGYSLILQIPPLPFMAAIFCVITSSPPKAEMVFIHIKMSSHSQRERALVCGHECVLFTPTQAVCFCVCTCALVSINVCVSLCATAGS